MQKNVDQQRLERWLIRKARKDKKNLTSSQSVDSGSQEGESHRPSLSKWKFCVHADKKKMLEELTNDIHHLPNKEKVLAELVNCIASGRMSREESDIGTLPTGSKPPYSGCGRNKENLNT